MASNSNSTSGNSTDNGHAGDHGGYYRTRNRLFDWYGRLLGPIPIAVYHYLARCADQNGCCFPSYEDIALKTGINRRSALRAIAKLVKYELITVKRRRHRPERRNDYTSNYYKIRLEAFTDKGAHREVVTHSHQLVTHSHSKDYPIKGDPIKEKERERKTERGGRSPLNPLDSLSGSLNSPQGETTQTAGENPETAKAEKNPCLSDPIPAVKIAIKAKENPPSTRKRQHQGNSALTSLLGAIG